MMTPLGCTELTEQPLNYGTDTALMTETTRRQRWLSGIVPLGTLWLAAGCNTLAPGIWPVGSPPTTAPVPYVASEPVPYESGKMPVIPTPVLPAVTGSDQGDRYIARQYPQGPSSAYQVLPPPAYQAPTHVSPPQTGYPSAPGVGAAAVPPGGVPVGPQGMYPPAYSSTPPGYAPQQQGLPTTGLSQPYASSPIAVDPLFGPNPYGPNVTIDPYSGAATLPAPYVPNTRMADLELTGAPARTGRIMVGGAVNSDAGVSGQITLDERNFDITRWPKSFQDFANGTAFRGAGQTFRVEAVPGSRFKRYTVSFAEPNLFDSPVSLGVSGFLFDRRYQDWDEERLGGRVSLGYRVTPDLSLSVGVSGQNVDVSHPRLAGVSALDSVLGDNELYTGEFKLTHDTRNSPFQASEGHFFEFGYERAFGDFSYDRFDVEGRKYFLISERADSSGKQTLAVSTRLGFSGEDTPIFENYFAGGYATFRGFDFRGASPVENTVQVGGRFQWLNTVEYMFPITADDAFRGVAFVDFGTVEREIELNKDNFRVAPGLGLRVAIPMLGPAPLAFDFAYPVTKADGDEKRVFSFYMSAIR